MEGSVLENSKVISLITNLFFNKFIQQTFIEHILYR